MSSKVKTGRPGDVATGSNGTGHGAKKKTMGLRFECGVGQVAAEVRRGSPELTREPDFEHMQPHEQIRCKMRMQAHCDQINAGVRNLKATLFGYGTIDGGAVLADLLAIQRCVGHAIHCAQHPD